MTFAAFSPFFARLTQKGKCAIALLLVSLAFGAQHTACAQAQVSPQTSVRLYRGFYYDAMDGLVHIEVVRNAAGRVIQPLSQAWPMKAAPSAPPASDNGLEAVLVGTKASYVVYYGLDASDAVPVAGQDSPVLRPLAFERLTGGEISRPIECAVPGGSVCKVPKYCHCTSTTAGCCCM